MQDPAHARQGSPPAEAGDRPMLYRVGDLVVDVRRERVTRDGQEIPLAKLTFDLLIVLVRAAPDVVRFDDLMERVWPGLVVGLDTVSQRIKKLRDALEDTSREPKYIAGVRGRGYRVVAPVEVITAPPEGAAPKETVASRGATALSESSGSTEASAPLQAAVQEQAAASGHASARIPPIAVGALLIVLVALIGGAWLLLKPARNVAVTSAPASVVPVTGKVRLALLPFVNLSPDPANSFFTDGLHEEILSALAQGAPGLEVISRTTMMTYRDQPKSVSELARETGATHVIEGSVRREGPRVRLTLQLIDARKDEEVWGRSFDRELTSAMTLQAEVASEVASQLAVELSRQALVPPTQDPQAYDLYLRARLALQSLFTTDPPENALGIEKLISAAIRRDPAFALAYIERFNLRSLQFESNFGDPEAMMKEMRADLDVAQRLMPNAPPLLAAEGTFAYENHEYQRALELFAAAEAAGFVNTTLLINKSIVTGRSQRQAESLALIERAVELDPRDPGVLAARGLRLFAMRRPADAIAAFKVFGERIPEMAPLADQFIAFTRWSFSGSDDARAAYVRSLEGFGTDDARLEALILQGKFREGREIATRIPERGPAQRLSTFSIPMGVGGAPLRALKLGELDLLLGDRAAAATSGKAVLDFVSTQGENPYNRWFLRTLTGIGRVLTGDNAGAITAARESVKLAPLSVDVVHWSIAAAEAASTLAWAGDADGAVDLLEQLAANSGGSPPAMLARSPKFTIPLARNARYQALVKRLEAQMAAQRNLPAAG